MDLSYILNSPDVERIASALEMLADNSDKSIFTDAMKTALLNIFQHVAYTDDQGQAYYDALYAALYSGGGNTYPRLDVVYTPGTHVVYTDDALDTLKPYLTVKRREDEQDIGTVVTDYTLSGTLVDGMSTVLVRADGLMTAVQVEAVELYDTYNWSTHTNLHVESVAPGYYNNTCGYSYKDGDNNRKSAWASAGKMGAYDTVSGEISDNYPIPVPNDAETMSVVIENATSLPNAMYAVVEWTYDDASGIYSRTVNGGWKEQGTDIQLHEGVKRFVTLNMKVNSAGTDNFPVDPVVSIIFS